MKKLLLLSLLGFTSYTFAMEEKVSQKNPQRVEASSVETKATSTESKETIKTDEDITKLFVPLIHENINQINLESPQTFLDAIVQLNKLLSNLELNNNNFSYLCFSEDYSIDNTTIPSDSSCPWMQDVYKTIFRSNEKVRNLIDFVVTAIAKNVTKDNKAKFVTVLEKYLPRPVALHIKKQIAHTYGWSNAAGIVQKEVNLEKTEGVCKHLPLDSSRVASVALDGSIIIWNTETDSIEHHFKGPVIQDPSKVHIAYNGKNVLVVTAGNRVRMWDIPSGKCIKSFNDPKKSFEKPKFISPTKLQLMCNDGTTQGPLLMNLATENNIKVPNTNALICLENNVILGSDGRSFSFLKPAQNHIKKYSSGYNINGINDMITLDATTCAAAAETYIILWDLKEWKWKKTLEDRKKPCQVTQLSTLSYPFMVSGSFIDTAHPHYLKANQAVKIWNAATGECLQTFNGYEKYKDGHSLVVTDDAIITCNKKTMRVIYLPTFEQTIDFLVQRNTKDKTCMIS